MTSGDVMITMNVRYQGRKVTTSGARLILIFSVRYLKSYNKYTINEAMSHQESPKRKSNGKHVMVQIKFLTDSPPSKVHQDWFHPSLCNFQRGWFVNKHVIKI